MTPGNDAQRAFLTEGFTRAHALAVFGESYTVKHQDRNGDQVFNWLFGDREGMRNAVRSAFLPSEIPVSPCLIDPFFAY